MRSFTITDRRERAIVGAADVVLAAAAAVTRPLRHRQPPRAPRRILLLRLERIGDLVMALPAIRDVRAHAPSAALDLVVGSWNLSIARALPYVDNVHALDAGWLARDAGGAGLVRLLRAARAWRGQRYDLAINFEPDIRSNVLLAAAGAGWTVGWTGGGGGPLLDVSLTYDTSVHTSENARRLVASVFGDAPQPMAQPLIAIPEEARRAASERLAGIRGGPVVGVHASGGRLVKQWEPTRFGDVARKLVERYGARIVLTGSAGDRLMVDAVKAVLPGDRVVDVAGEIDLLELAAILSQLDVLITGDTGPMHVAAAVGTPVVAVFGPSDPIRYAPSGPADRTVRAGIECSPCNRVRNPPAHCVGHIPECLSSVPAAQVYDAACSSLDYSARHRRPVNHATA
jgi:heptosyltransferase-2/heptosyltransferase-3